MTGRRLVLPSIMLVSLGAGGLFSFWFGVLVFGILAGFYGISTWEDDDRRDVDDRPYRR